MTALRTAAVAVAAMGLGIAIGRALPREVPLRVPSPTAPVRGGPDRSCPAAHAELATAKAQLNLCLAVARPGAPAPATDPVQTPGERQSIDAVLAELPAIHAAQEGARELVVVRYRDGRVRAYRPEECPDGGFDGARVVRRKLPDGTWEEYDPVPQLVQMAGPPSPDGLVTLPDGRRVRYVFTDGGP